VFLEVPFDRALHEAFVRELIASFVLSSHDGIFPVPFNYVG